MHAGQMVPPQVQELLASPVVLPSPYLEQAVQGFQETLETYRCGRRGFRWRRRLLLLLLLLLLPLPGMLVEQALADVPVFGATAVGQGSAICGVCRPLPLPCPQASGGRAGGLLPRSHIRAGRIKR